MSKTKNLKWNVFRENINTRIIEKYNVFDHCSFYNDVTKLPRKNKIEFSESLRKEAMYYFWSKCEMEVVIVSWPPHINLDEYKRLTKEYDEHVNKRGEPPRLLNVHPTVGEKIDIYEQLMLNWDLFVDYTWNTLNS
jgi:hypothetical protein